MTFTNLFYKHIMFRHSCGVCHYTNLNRPSDITLADFWGWEKVVPGFNDDDHGISLVLCNTEKGKELFEKAKCSLNIKKVPIKECLQPNLIHPSEIHPKRDSFEIDYSQKGFNYILNKYEETNRRDILKIYFRKLYKQILSMIR